MIGTQIPTASNINRRRKEIGGIDDKDATHVGVDGSIIAFVPRGMYALSSDALDTVLNPRGSRESRFHSHTQILVVGF